MIDPLGNDHPSAIISRDLRDESARQRLASFEPQLVAKNETRWHGFDDKILLLYARGMTTREIQGHLEEIYPSFRCLCFSLGIWTAGSS